MKELANTSRRGMKNRDIRSIPEFRQHLITNDLTFEQWEKRNAAATPDALTESLRLRVRVLRAKFK